MAPFPQNALRRLFVDYGGPMGKRTMQFHIAGGVSEADAIAAARRFITTLASFCYTGVSFSAARWAQADSNLSFPRTWAAINAPAGNPMPLSAYPVFASFVGRTEAGRRARLFAYGTFFSVPTDFRLTTGDTSSVATLVSAIRAEDTILRGVDGARIVWKDYVNMGYNAYYQRKYRS